MNISFFMNEALKEANKALSKNEVPIGGIIIDNNSKIILSRGHNQINNNKNAIYHCEIALIFEATKKLQRKYLNNTTLFVTLEPCTMCAAAISEAHISTVYFAAYDEKNGGVEKLRIAFNKNNIFVPDIYGGICESQSKKMLKNFFKNNRK